MEWSFRYPLIRTKFGRFYGPGISEDRYDAESFPTKDGRPKWVENIPNRYLGCSLQNEEEEAPMWEGWAARKVIK